ncbi:ABC transporter ATP-binding protein [Oxalicibacterium flavum]|uniref:ABC transporter ATP-binding protein n=1 Tax=Oxalicibacterium flavum TaxID=179467 RepID=A0A8J2XXV9_9BURK|nr:ATP-binding cassette domain-containing protein [Oxalicibacterium flavum]GGC06353.1 ABC transporter ATP-binding protein [Oxalicibacterium flavum]
MSECDPSQPTSAQHDDAAIIEISQLRTQFGDTVVHENLDLRIDAGEIVSLVGGSGSGKTVLLRQMLGLNRPAAGTVRVFGEDINRIGSERLQALRTRWGMLFQHGALFSALTVFDNVAQPLRELRVLPKDVVRDVALLKLQMAGIGPEHARKMPADLSGGMIKRVALARALALDPDLVFLDEPTAGLDPNASESFVDLIRELHDEMKLTVVMVTHDLDTLFALSSRVAVLADKHIIAYCAPDKVVEFKHPFIETFFRGERGQRAFEALPEQQEKREDA